MRLSFSNMFRKSLLTLNIFSLILKNYCSAVQTITKTKTPLSLRSKK